MTADIADALDAVSEASVEELESELARAQVKLAKREQRIKTLERSVRELANIREETERRAAFMDAIANAEVPPPRWLTPKRNKSKGKRQVTVGLMLSDLHLDEVVRPEEMNWVNKYNRQIALMRFERVIESTIKVATEIFSYPDYDGIVVSFNGDVFSGIIHQELRESNDATMFESLLFWEPIFVGAIDRLASAFGKFHGIWQYGNHGRMSHKPVAKNRARDNMEWLFAHNVARHFVNDPRVTMTIPESADTQIQVYDHVMRLEHGDAFSGGSGIAGAVSPLLLGVHRATRQAMAENRPFDVMGVGHWHQYLVAPSKGLIINGALKGYDEYARGKKFEPEPAQQAFWLWTPEYGVSFAAPIMAQDPVAEGWLDKNGNPIKGKA